MINKDVIRILESYLFRLQDDLKMHIAAKKEIATTLTENKIRDVEEAIKFLESN